MKIVLLVYSLLFTFFISNVLCQDDDYEDEDDEESADVNVITTTRVPLAFIPFLTFAEQFRQLTEPKGSAATAAAPAVAADSSNSSSNAAPQSSSTGNATGTTTRRPLRSTTEMTRMAEVAQGVNGILGSVTNFDIPGIVDQALSIRDYAPVRKLVKNILDGIFCLPVLNNLSDCGKRLAAANAAALSTTTAIPRKRPSRRPSFPDYIDDTTLVIPVSTSTLAIVESITNKTGST